MYFRNQKFFVAGMSVSGESSARFLLERGADVYIYDDVVSDKVQAVMTELSGLGAHIVTADKCEAAALRCDILVLSPGIPIDNALPVAFRKRAIMRRRPWRDFWCLTTGGSLCRFTCTRPTASVRRKTGMWTGIRRRPESG